MLDAPVSGGEPKAIDGTLSIMVGGDRETFDQVKPVLGAMGATVVHVGEIGAGNIAKLANQVVVALNIAAVSEALVLAQKAGVSPEAVFEAIRGGLAGSTVLEAKAPMMLDHNFKPGFRISLHIKDLVNALDTSHEVGAHLPLTAAVLEMMTALEAEGTSRKTTAGSSSTTSDWPAWRSGARVNDLALADHRERHDGLAQQHGRSCKRCARTQTGPEWRPKGHKRRTLIGIRHGKRSATSSPLPSVRRTPMDVGDQGSSVGWPVMGEQPAAPTGSPG